MADIDLKVLPLHRQSARNLAYLPGLHAADPPRRASRSRRTDQLILLLSFDVPAFSDDRLAELLTRLEKMYYEKSGSTTSAMRELIEDLNSLVLNLNLKYASERPQVTGSVAVIVIRGDLLFLAQSGPGHLFALLPGKVDYLHDDNLPMRSLGSSRTPTVYYAQMQFAPGDKFLFSTTLPDGWDADTFTAAYNTPVHKAQQRFLSDAGEAIKGMIIEAAPGSGKLTVLQAPPPAQAESAEPIRQPEPARSTREIRPSERAVETAAEAAAEPDNIEYTEPAAMPVAEPPRQAPVRRPPAPAPSRQPQSQPMPEREPEPAEQQASRRRTRGGSSRQAREAAANLAPGLLNVLQKVQLFGRKALGGVKNLLQRLVPGEELVKIPTSYMAFIAVAVPLLVVTVAALVYAQIGRNQQYDLYFSQAQAMAQVAAAETEVGAQRQAWGTTIELVDTALDYLVTDEAQDLRQLAIGSLDAIDQVTRLQLVQAISGTLASSIKIRDMVATSRDLYMLDINSDSVLRAWLAGSRYEMDPEFLCGAGQYGSIIVQDLIDLALLPDNPDDAILVAMDRGGNLLYCYEDKPPVAITMTPPDSFWGKPISITVENDRLYVLDEQLNMVWFYEPTDESYQFREAPFFFFTEEVPNMQDTIDFAVDQETLYLLYLNGQTTTCTYTGLDEAPTTCTDPTMYNDTRPGRSPAATIDDAVFYQIQHTLPPEPSLYYLDPINRSVYHFSLKLNLVQQYKPQEDLEEGYITAFVVSPTKTIFLAMENKVYLAHLP